MAELTVEQLNEAFARNRTDIMAEVSAMLADSQEKATEIEKAVAKVEDSAKLEEKGIASALGGITKFEIMGIPLGSALVGGAVAILATELVDGFLSAQSTQIKGIVKLVVAGTYAKWGFGGSEMKKVVALLMTFDALRDLTPISGWMHTLSTKVTGTFPTRGLGTYGPRPGNPSTQSQDYYKAAFGR